MKKKMCIVICAAAFLSGMIQIACALKVIHIVQFLTGIDDSVELEDDYGSFTPEDVSSYDGRLTACQRVEGVSLNRMTRQVIVDIKDNETGETVGSFSPARAWDFWGICWERDNYNIWIQSGDIGCYCYRYENGIWECDWFDTERPDYIISKYDRKKESGKREEAD